MTKPWTITRQPDQYKPLDYAPGGGGGSELADPITGVTCAFCDCKLGKSYLVSRGKACCTAKKCRFKLAREKYV